MSTSIEYVSFLVRMWRERNQGSAGNAPPVKPATSQDWSSEVEHIQSGQCWHFHTLNDLLGFLRQQGDDPGVLHQVDKETESEDRTE